MQRNAVQRNAMQCNVMQCNTMQCNAMQCSAMQCNMQCVVRQVVLMLWLDTTTVEKEALDRVNISLPGLQACAPVVCSPVLSRVASKAVLRA